MKARLLDQQLLIDLARLDGVIRTADAARRNPAQSARVSELLNERHAQSAVLTGLLGDRDDARAELDRLESDVALVDARTARDTERLAATSNAKEAQGLEHELASDRLFLGAVRTDGGGADWKPGAELKLDTR